MIFIYRFRFTIFSLAFSQLIATLGFVPVTRASSLMPPANEYAIEFHPPENRGAPDGKARGAHRCSPSRFTPFVPLDTSRDYSPLPPLFGLTIRPNPTFWLQIRSRPSLCRSWNLARGFRYFSSRATLCRYPRTRSGMGRTVAIGFGRIYAIARVL